MPDASGLGRGRDRAMRMAPQLPEGQAMRGMTKT